MPRTATLVRANLPRFAGTAHLYRLSEPLREYDEEEGASYGHVVVSAAVTLSGPETYIFGADETGEILDWGELPGSFKGALDHGEALSRAGYSITEPASSP